MHYVLYTRYLQMVYVVFSYMFRSQLGDHLQGVYIAVTITITIIFQSVVSIIRICGVIINVPHTS
jgi:cell division protein FtsW (lipid II flippase)